MQALSLHFLSKTCSVEKAQNLASLWDFNLFFTPSSLPPFSLKDLSSWEGTELVFSRIRFLNLFLLLPLCSHSTQALSPSLPFLSKRLHSWCYKSRSFFQSSWVMKSTCILRFETKSSQPHFLYKSVFLKLVLSSCSSNMCSKAKSRRLTYNDFSCLKYGYNQGW